MFAQPCAVCRDAFCTLSALRNFSAEKFSQKLFSSDFKRQHLRDSKKGCFESEFFVEVSLLTFGLPVVVSTGDFLSVKL